MNNGADPGTDTSSVPGSRPVGVQITDLKKHFRRAHGETVTAVDGITVEIPRGEFVVLLGPSGCGKTTLLRCVAGLEQPDSGSIEVSGRAVFDGQRGINVEVPRRGAAMVFQSYALWPHMNVMENVGFPLRTRHGRRTPRSEVKSRVAEALETIGIADLITQPVGQLSGGQQQRVSLARAVAAGSDVVLFDEPLSNVDARVRDQLRSEIRVLQRKLGFTAIYVTHDQEEAMELADRVIVLDDGRIAQIGTPHEIYERPDNPYVAEFIGHSNTLTGRVENMSPGEVSVLTDIGPVRASGGTAGLAVGQSAAVVSRVHRWTVAPVETAATPNSWTGVIEDVRFLGPYELLVVKVGEQVIRVWIDRAEFSEGDSVRVGVSPAACWVVAER